MLHYRLHQDPNSSHQQIRQLLEQLHPRQVLDVGAAQGFLGQLLQGSGIIVDAVEPNPQWAEQARPFYRRVYASSIEQAEIPAGAYDLIVCADVLEHLPDPAAVLRDLRQIASDDATFLISVPNVAHLAIRAMLLFGRFPKMDRGILDRTHLHFYTRDTAHDLLRSAGLRVGKTLAVGVPLEEIWPRGMACPMYATASAAQRMFVKLLPRLLGYQWILLARKA